jgi:hypothetical protein
MWLAATGHWQICQIPFCDSTLKLQENLEQELNVNAVMNWRRSDPTTRGKPLIQHGGKIRVDGRYMRRQERAGLLDVPFSANRDQRAMLRLCPLPGCPGGQLDTRVALARRQQIRHEPHGPRQVRAPVQRHMELGV